MRLQSFYQINLQRLVLIIWAVFLCGNTYSQCETYIKNARILLKQGNYQKTISLLLYAQEICPDGQKGNINILMQQAFINIAGERDRAIKAEKEVRIEQKNVIRERNEARGQVIAMKIDALPKSQIDRHLRILGTSWTNYQDEKGEAPAAVQRVLADRFYSNLWETGGTIDPYIIRA